MVQGREAGPGLPPSSAALWERLVDRIAVLERDNPRYGRGKGRAPLRREGWRVTRKHVHWQRRAEGLKVPVSEQERKRLRCSVNARTRTRAEHPHHVRSLLYGRWRSTVFGKDQTQYGLQLTMLPVVDEFTRERLPIEVERSITAKDTVASLQQLFVRQPALDFIRSGNRLEFIMIAAMEWLKDTGVKTLFIAPGPPWEPAPARSRPGIAYGLRLHGIETFNSRFESELLGQEIFSNLTEAKVLVWESSVKYTNERPHSSLCYMTSAEFAWAHAS